MTQTLEEIKDSARGLNGRRRVEVATKLVEAEGEWIPGPELANKEVGGSEGLRRLRELRSEPFNWPIISRRKPGPGRVYEYKVEL